MKSRLTTIILLALCTGCAHTPPDDPADPLENVNRKVFKFNRVLDKYALRPVTRAYVKVLPRFARTGVSNFLENLGYPTVIVSDVLQGKIDQAWSDTGRFLINTTIGFGGLVDTASWLEVEDHDEDFGQSFGYWGVGQGWYIMLPLLGPTTNRDLTGTLLSAPLNPTWYAHSEYSTGVTVLGALDTRAKLLDADKMLEQAFDPYTFLRGTYLQRRYNTVYDGNPPPQSFEDYEDY